MQFHLASYERHQYAKHESNLVHTWRNTKTVDYWRHYRMYKQLDPLLTSYPQAKWLTVGDGRYGTDAHYIRQFGIDVLASDINDSCMKEAKDEGFISKYAVENAENLSFENDNFDFVLCKESYHHFPRPMLALYEMLRVSKNGIILIEPNDHNILEPYNTGINSSLFWNLFSLKQWVRRKIGKKPASYINRYESLGNYVYSISKRELEKVALGLNLDAIATKGMNDFYIEGVEFENIEDNGPLFKTVKENLDKLDTQSKHRPETYGLLVAIIFKKMPSSECLKQLQDQNFEITYLDKNPYLSLA